MSRTSWISHYEREMYVRWIPSDALRNDYNATSKMLTCDLWNSAKSSARIFFYQWVHQSETNRTNSMNSIISTGKWARKTDRLEDGEVRGWEVGGGNSGICCRSVSEIYAKWRVHPRRNFIDIEVEQGHYAARAGVVNDASGFASDDITCEFDYSQL